MNEQSRAERERINAIRMAHYAALEAAQEQAEAPETTAALEGSGVEFAPAKPARKPKA